MADTLLWLPLWSALLTPERQSTIRSAPAELRGCYAETMPTKGKAMGLENGQSR